MKTKSAYENNYSISENAEVVNVAEFRDRISHLEHSIRCDKQSCVGEKEKTHWLHIMKGISSELFNTTCKRAKVQDWDRRERIIDEATMIIIKAELGPVGPEKKIEKKSNIISFSDYQNKS